MSGRFLPADHEKGDANTIGGYAAVHSRPAAFAGDDGVSYSVEIAVDRTEDGGDTPFAAYFLFLRWRRIGAQGVEGHLESGYLRVGRTAAEAMAALGAMQLAEVHAILNALIAERAPSPERRWWDVARDATDDADGTA
ncbi:MAG: hypothetical protein U0163_06315 [Gemmatimonadaceae bacterium]